MRLLLVQTGFFGDVVLSTPVIAGLNKIHSGAELWVMTTPAASELVRHDPLVAGVISFDKRGVNAGPGGLWAAARDLRRRHFDAAYALHRSYRTALLLRLAGVPRRIGFRQAALGFLYHRQVSRQGPHEVLRNLCLLEGERAGIELSGDLRIFPPPDDKVSPALRDAAGGRGRTAVLAPGSAWPTKMWDWRGYRRVAEHLLGRGWRVVVIGSAGEVPVADRVAAGLGVANIAGKASLGEAVWLMSRAGLTVCNDSLALHLASAFKVPAVAVFCATSPAFGFGPWRNRAEVVEKRGLSCKPCRRHGGRRCPAGTQACMAGLPAEEVIAAIERVCAAPSQAGAA